MTSSTVFHYPLYPAISVLWWSWMISNLNSLFFRTYIFSSFNTNLSSICYSLFLNTLTPVFFISSTTFTTLLSFASNFLIFSIISSSAPLINNCLLHLSNLQPFFLQYYLVFIISFYSLCPIHSFTQTICLSHTLASYML